MSLEFELEDDACRGFQLVVVSYLNSELSLQLATPALLDEVLKNKQLFIGCCDLFRSVFRIAAQVPVKHSYHVKLAVLVNTIPKEGQTKTGSVEVDLELWGRSTWADFPMLWFAVWEIWDHSPWKQGDGFNEEILSKMHEWVNMSAYMATLTVMEIKNYEDDGIAALIDALEGSFGKTPSYASSAYYLDCYLPIAAAWVIVAGRYVLGCTQRKKHNTDETKPIKSGPLWTGPAKLNADRWEFWKSRFQAATENERCKEATRTIAQEAVEAMDEAEMYGGLQVDWNKSQISSKSKKR
jgi:hypothetical protein